MSTAANLILIEISPTRQQLTVLRHGEMSAQRSVRLDPAPSHSSGPTSSGAVPQRRWAEQLTSFQAVLAGWVEELSLVGRAASIVYSGPDSAASVYSVPAVTGPAAGRAAAELAISEAASFSLDAATTDIHLLRTDASDGVNADGSVRPSQMHHLAAIDSDISAAAVCRCVENAGLVVQRAATGSAAMLGAAWSLASAHATGNGACAVLWFGEHGSALVAGTTQRLAFARYLPHGVEHLIDALVRASPVRAAPTTTQTEAPPARAELRRALLCQGVSDSPTTHATSESGTFAGDTVSLPLVRPVLQRLAIEVKQSVRFGLSPEERGELRVLLAGPGASIPHIDGVLSTDAGVIVTRLAGQPAEPGTEAGAMEGESSAFLAVRDIPLCLLPRSRREAVRFTGLRRALRVGAALAVLTSLVDAGHHYFAVKQQEEILTQLRREQATPSPARDALASASSARVGVVQARARLRQLLPDSPSAAALLVLLSEETPGEVRLRSIDLGPDRGGWSARLSGVVTLDPGSSQAPAEALKRYLDQLAAAPLVLAASLGPTHSAPGTSTTQLMFDASITLVGLPGDELRDAISAGRARTELSRDSHTTAETTGGRP